MTGDLPACCGRPGKNAKNRLPGHEKMLRCDNFLAEQFDLTVPEGSGKTKIN